MTTSHLPVTATEVTAAAGRLTTPYAAWVAVAGVLTASIVARHRNRGRR